MFDWIIDIFEWCRERLEDFHEILCGLPQVGPLFDEQPIIAYLIVGGTIGGFIWWKMNVNG